jgi:hypothetical protein
MDLVKSIGDGSLEGWEVEVWALKVLLVLGLEVLPWSVSAAFLFVTPQYFIYAFYWFIW